MALKPEYQKFVAEFLVSFNATQAAIAAGYSEKTAYSQGSRLLNNVEIAREIKTILDAQTMDASEVLYHLTQIARGDIAYALDDFGSIDVREAKRLKKSNLIKRYKTKSILIEGSGEENAGGQNIEEAEIEMYDRLKALELLAKYHNLVNRVIIEDWRSEAIDLIRKGQLEFQSLADEMGISLAEELFISAGVQLTDEGTASESRREE